MACVNAGVGVAGAALGAWRLRASLPEGLASLGSASCVGAGRSDSESEELTTKGSNELCFALSLAKVWSSACEGVEIGEGCLTWVRRPCAVCGSGVLLMRRKLVRQQVGGRCDDRNSPVHLIFAGLGGI